MDIKGKRDLSDTDYRHLVEQGAALVRSQKGYGFPKDLEHIESRGVIEGAHIEAVSQGSKRAGAETSWGQSVRAIILSKSERSQQIFLPEIGKSLGS